MDKQDLFFTPHSDMSIDDTELVNEYVTLINNGKFDDATALLNSKGYNKGFRASIFNGIQNKIKIVQEYLYEKGKVESNEIITDTEPSNSDKQFWMLDY